MCCIPIQLIIVALAAVIISLLPALTIYIVFVLLKRPRLGEKAITALVCVVFLAILVPQGRMLLKLSPLAKKFNKACNTDHREYQSENGEHVLADFGGSLDDITFERDEVLRANQYLGFGGWHYMNDSPNTVMLYIYTYLPESTYDRLFPNPYRRT